MPLSVLYKYLIEGKPYLMFLERMVWPHFYLYDLGNKIWLNLTKKGFRKWHHNCEQQNKSMSCKRPVSILSLTILREWIEDRAGDTSHTTSDA